MFRRVRDSVLRKTSNRQEPFTTARCRARISTSSRRGSDMVERARRAWPGRCAWRGVVAASACLVAMGAGSGAGIAISGTWQP